MILTCYSREASYASRLAPSVAMLRALPFVLAPNGLRLSGERSRAKRVRCSRGLGSAPCAPTVALPMRQLPKEYQKGQETEQRANRMKTPQTREERDGLARTWV